jgi:hypothetical protein
MFSFFHLAFIIIPNIITRLEGNFQVPPLKKKLEINDSIYNWILVVMNTLDYKML